MVRAFDCKELAGFTTTELSEYLADAERARPRTLGFNPAQFAVDKTAPDRTTLGCAWRDRFSDRLTFLITQSTKRILAVAHSMGNLLGMRELKPTNKIDCSSRSQQRHITEKAKDVTDALCQIVFPAIELDRPDAGTQYADTAFLNLQIYLGLPGTAANQGSRIFDEETTRDAGDPAGDTHLQSIKQLDAMDRVDGQQCDW